MSDFSVTFSKGEKKAISDYVDYKEGNITKEEFLNVAKENKAALDASALSDFVKSYILIYGTYSKAVRESEAEESAE